MNRENLNLHVLPMNKSPEFRLQPYPCMAEVMIHRLKTNDTLLVRLMLEQAKYSRNKQLHRKLSDLVEFHYSQQPSPLAT